MNNKLKHLVSVYGSLLRDRGNHGVIGRYIPLDKAKYLGEETTEAIFSMHDLGSFPGLSATGTNKIHTEIYALDDDAFSSVRALEGYSPSGNGMYDELEIETQFGKSVIYIYNFGFNSEAITPNDDNIVNWNTYYTEKLKSYTNEYW